MTKNQNPLSEAKPKMSRVDAELLIPGRGNPIENASLVWEGREIEYVGKSEDLPSRYSSLNARKVSVLMPGLWDCHVHYLGTTTTSLEPLATLPQALAGARIARDVAATLNAGFTSVRELAGYGVFVSKAIEDGWIPGPKIYSSHSIISMTAGHGDLHSLPLSLIKDGMEHGLPMHVVDGVDECVKGVRKQIRSGAKVIKICSTGGVLSLIDDPEHAEFSPAEIRAMVDEAARANRIVAAHAHGKRGIMDALQNGVQTIEHGSYLDGEAIDLMLQRDATLVATRTIVDFGARHLDDFNEESRKKMREIADAHRRNYARAVKAGVRCALGTDLGFDNPAIDHRHGMNGKEFGFAVQAGMTPLQAIEAGTANAPMTLGPQAPKSGMLCEGYDADFIALDKNPLDDIGVLAQPAHITHVWKGGKLFKEPGKQVGFTF